MIALCQEPVRDLQAHARIGSTFDTDRVFEVAGPPERPVLRERVLAMPLRKDYDALEDPQAWPRDFDTSRWVLISAKEGANRIAGAIGAIDTPGVDMLEGRSDLAVVWDLRVAPQARRRGLATTLLAALGQWAGERGCRELKVETQNTNRAACRLYAACGFRLAQANFNAYPALADEVQLIWRRPIQR